MLVVSYLAELSQKKRANAGDEEELLSEERLLLQLEDLKHEYNQLITTSSDESDVNTHKTDVSLLIYNQAALYFAFARFEHVLQLLTPLFDRYQELLEKQVVLDKLQELLSLKICFLLLETFFAQDKVQRAEVVMNYLNTAFQSLLNFQPTVSISVSSPHSDYLSVVECKFYLHIYRARFNLLRRDLLGTKQEINTAMQTLSSDKIPSSVMSSLCVLRANIEYLNSTLVALSLEQQMRTVDRTQLYSACVEILSECKDSLSPVVYYNNLGCIQMRSQRVFVAGTMFGKGIKEISGEKFIDQLEQGRLMYNAGIQSMNMQAYTGAFKMFGNAAFVMYNNPLLWVRLAECCIAEHQLRVSKVLRSKTPKMHISSNNDVNDESATCIVLPTFTSHLGLPLTSSSQDRKEPLSVVTNKHNIELLQSRGVRQDVGQMSLETADICLRNAMTLMMSAGTYHPLLEHVLIKMAYVSLELDDPVMSLASCKKLLATPQCSQYTRYAIYSEST
jgi:tetratricopeptide (TPR) repeat protein